MALVQNYRKPDVFLIMTINPKWDEITCELEPGQTPQDHPDLVTRISVMFLIRKTQAGRCLQCIARLTGSMSGLEISFIEISQCGLLGRRQLNEGVL
ncbi:hypothetical protein OsJ_35966 [Oryza sativa Japonica Group]|uniref:Helitron helicase-like domain-containing protein n=1 Tax=Oryza sativa subsp. japonica TaxID=39947 RepID=B9GCZ0_ORYSJ|nr:hypothetical protein OsJ_35966 [Oryza sativa Japonica Group]